MNLTKDTPSEVTEEWRPAAGYEGLYSVSSLGRVRRDAPGQRTRPGLIRANTTRKNGYPAVSLSKGDVSRLIQVHRLVAMAFMPRADIAARRLQVHHKNGDRTDNTLANLIWVTPSGHSQYTKALRQYAHGEAHCRARLSDDKVRAIRRRHADGEDARVMATEYGVSAETVWQVLRGVTWRHV